MAKTPTKSEAPVSEAPSPDTPITLTEVVKTLSAVVGPLKALSAQIGSLIRETEGRHNHSGGPIEVGAIKDHGKRNVLHQMQRSVGEFTNAMSGIESIIKMNGLA